MWPLVERELRLALRRNAPRHRWYVALICGGGAAFLLLLSMAGVADGILMLRALLWAGVYVCVLQAMSTCADAFTEDRRCRTMSLLFLAGLTPWQVFVSKVTGRVVYVLGNLLALLPFAALPFLAGGVSLACFIATYVLLFNALMFAVAIALLGSMLCEDEGAAAVVSSVLAGVLVFLPAGIWWLMQKFSGSSAPDWLLFFSPGYPARLVYLGLPPNLIGSFWIGSGITFAYAVIAIASAGLILCRTWQDEQEIRFVRRIRERFQRGRNERREHWLSTLPFGWLVIRDRVVPGITMFALVAIGVLWCCAALAWTHAWATPVNALATAILLNFVFMAGVSIMAARRFAEDRHSGALEILLTTPLSVVEIVDGYKAALREQFRPAARLLWVLTALLVVVPLFTRAWTWLSLTSYGLMWLLVWILQVRVLFRSAMKPMWVSLNTGSSWGSWMRCSGANWTVWTWLCISLSTGSMRMVKGFPAGSAFEVAVVALILFVSVILVHAFEVEETPEEETRLLQHLRSLAAQPVPPKSDPVWKHWDMKEPIRPSAPNPLRVSS